MTKSHEYLKHPIVEAIFELFSESPGSKPDVPSTAGWKVGSMERVLAKFPEFASHEERLQDVGLQMQMGADGVVRRTTQEPRERVRRWNETKTLAIQFGRHMCAHNVLGTAYVHFEPDHVATIERVVHAYLDEAKPEMLAWIGQRYINRIEIPAGDDPVEYFTIYPRLAETLTGHRPFALQLETETFPAGRVTVSLRSSPDEVVTLGKPVVYMLDIYARSEEGEIPVDPLALITWYRKAHDAISRSFELSITDNSRRMFEEQV